VLGTANLLKNFVFTYFPTTDWRRFVSPTIVFGNANIADRDIEQEVVDTVGSYGYQLNRILDALTVIIRNGDLEDPSLTEQERRALYRLLDLAEAADEAAQRAKSAAPSTRAAGSAPAGRSGRPPR
jgi:hypothetical protein